MRPAPVIELAPAYRIGVQTYALGPEPDEPES
jgi:hypothetical protein